MGYKEMKEMGGNACWDCHRDVPHTRSRSEVSTPHSHVPMPDTHVPDWLSTAMKRNQIK
jgi:cytochrome c nitrite reductase small subunit